MTTLCVFGACRDRVDTNLLRVLALSRRKKRRLPACRDRVNANPLPVLALSRRKSDDLPESMAEGFSNQQVSPII